MDRVIREKNCVSINDDPQFCVELDVERGWLTSLLIPNVDEKIAEVLVDYVDDSI